MKLNLFRALRRLPFMTEKKGLEWYPPFWLMRVKVLELSDNWRIVRLKLPLTMFSRNLGDSMFGGYQTAVSDPIAALACAKRFPGHEVWTRSHNVDFQYEGNSHLELRFEFSEDIENKIKTELEEKGRSTPVFEYGFYREDGVRCTLIKNKVAIRPRGYQAKIDRTIDRSDEKNRQINNDQA